MSAHPIKDRCLGFQVYLQSNGAFTTTVNGDPVGEASWEGLQKSIENTLQEQADAKEHTRQVNARRKANATIPAWTWDRTGGLVPVTYRGRHARTGAILITTRSGAKNDKFHGSLFVGVTEEQIVQSVALRANENDIRERLLEVKARRVTNQDRRATIVGELTMVIKDSSYRATALPPVAEVPFTVTDDHRFALDYNDEVLEADTFDALAGQVICRLHPHYGAPVWVTDDEVVRGPQPFAGQVKGHATDGESAYNLSLFTSAEDANLYLALLKKQEDASGEGKAFAASLNRLDTSLEG